MFTTNTRLVLDFAIQAWSRSPIRTFEDVHRNMHIHLHVTKFGNMQENVTVFTYSNHGNRSVSMSHIHVCSYIQRFRALSLHAGLLGQTETYM